MVVKQYEQIVPKARHIASAVIVIVEVVGVVIHPVNRYGHLIRSPLKSVGVVFVSQIIVILVNIPIRFTKTVVLRVRSVGIPFVDIRDGGVEGGEYLENIDLNKVVGFGLLVS